MITSEALAAIGEALPRALAPIRVLERLDVLSAGDDRVAVACSGGADSVAAALWLCAHYPSLRSPRRLFLFHVHHGLRGIEADADAAFVGSLAEGLGIEWVEKRFEPGTRHSEGSLREARQELLREAAEACHAGSMLFGHHADDVLENLVFRLARGASLSGLAGLRPIQELPGFPTRLRPLIRVSRAQIEVALRAAGVPWRTDLSNLSPAYTRNRLRASLIPLLGEIFPGRNLQAAAGAVHQQLEEVDALIDGQAAEWLGKMANDADVLPVGPLRAAQPAIRRRILEKWSRRLDGKVLSRPILSELLEALETGGEKQWKLAGEKELVLDHRNVGLAVVSARAAAAPKGKAPALILTPDSILTLPNGSRLEARYVDFDSSRLNAVLTGEVQPNLEAYLALPEGESATLHVRHWHPGDRFRPLGAPGSRKLQDWFSDRRVPPGRRHQLPVICAAGGAILWVPGLPPAESHRVSPTTRKALWLTYHSDESP